MDASRLHLMPLRLRLTVKLSLESPNFIWCLQTHGQSPHLVSVKSVPEARALSSTSITWLQWSYGPLRLPSLPASYSLLRVATSHQGRASHGTQATFLTCCPHYPGRSEQVLSTISSLSCFGLPRILGGSASTTVLSGACQGLLAFRAARLLQALRL